MCLTPDDKTWLIAQFQRIEERFNERIDVVEAQLSAKVDQIEARLTQKIERVAVQLS